MYRNNHPQRCRQDRSLAKERAPRTPPSDRHTVPGSAAHSHTRLRHRPAPADQPECSAPRSGRTPASSSGAGRTRSGTTGRGSAARRWFRLKPAPRRRADSAPPTPLCPCHRSQTRGVRSGFCGLGSRQCPHGVRIRVVARRQNTRVNRGTKISIQWGRKFRITLQ